MGDTIEILTRVRNGELDVNSAELILREQILNEYEQSLRFASFGLEVIAEADVPDGISDPPFFQPRLLGFSVEVHRNSDGEWCDENENEISDDLVWIGKQRFGAEVAGWSSLTRHSVFGVRFENVYIRMDVKASATEMEED